MRSIPHSLLTKIQKSIQTKGEGNDPRIQLIFQRTNRFIEQGSAFMPYDIREKAGLGAIDLAIRREDRKTAPDKLFMIYIDGGIAKVAWTDYIQAIERHAQWEDLYTIGEAVDVAGEFDGYWVPVADDADVCFDAPANYTHITSGEPWWFRVLSNGKLLARYGEHGTDIELASDATKVSAIRGWKSIPVPENDQGLVVAYIRGSDGALRYRNYAQQQDASLIWESAKTVAEFGDPAQNVAVMRTNDYRIVFLAEMAGEVHWAVTRRNWAGMGVPPERIHVGLIDYELDLIRIFHVPVTYEETIKASLVSYELILLWGVHTEVLSVENFPIEVWDEEEEYVENWGRRIKLTFAHPMNDHAGQEAGFIVKDSEDTSFSVGETLEGDNPEELILRVADFNNAVGDLTVIYDSNSANLLGEAGQEQGNFDITFTPENLEVGEPPAVEEIWNE